MITKANLLACAASIVLGAGGPLNFQNGCVLTYTGVGTYTLLVDEQQQLPLSVAIPQISVIKAPGVAGFASVALTNETSGPSGNQTLYTITTAATNGGVAADFAGTLAVAILSVGEPGEGV